METYTPTEEKVEVFVPRVTPYDTLVKGKTYMHPKHGKSKYMGCRIWACPHGRQRAKCIECGGSSVCNHGKQRAECRECGGSQICPHNQRRHMCKECGGRGLCPHGRQRARCRDCGGRGICIHGRDRVQCTVCRTADQLISHKPQAGHALLRLRRRRRAARHRQVGMRRGQPCRPFGQSMGC